MLGSVVIETAQFEIGHSIMIPAPPNRSRPHLTTEARLRT